MRLLLDTHALLWWSQADPRLPSRVASLFLNDDNEIYVSAASTWEICTKSRLGKLFGAEDMTGDFAAFLSARRLAPLAITVEHAQLAGNMKGEHKDPFDRMLAAQSIIENMPLITDDEALSRLGVKILW